MMKLDYIDHNGPHFTGDIRPKHLEYIYSQVTDGLRVFVKATNIPDVYRYGAEQLTDSWDHKAGYIWSSRPGVLNALFSEEFIDIVYNNCCGYVMRASDVEKYISDDYYISRVFSQMEPCYILKKKPSYNEL